MVQIKTFTSYSSLSFENEINLWIEKHAYAYAIKEIKIYPSEHHYFAYIIYDDKTFVDNSTAEMWL